MLPAPAFFLLFEAAFLTLACKAARDDATFRPFQPMEGRMPVKASPSSMEEATSKRRAERGYFIMTMLILILIQ
jgi:hypothetical protein